TAGGGALRLRPSRRFIPIYVLGAGYAGAAGALLAQTTQIVSLDLFDFHRSADVMLMLIIGGAGYLYGGLIGAGAFIVLRDVISAATPNIGNSGLCSLWSCSCLPAASGLRE